MLTFVSDLLERPLKKGKILENRYQIEQFIGRGSYGLVYKARDLHLQSVVIVKQQRKRRFKQKQDLLMKEAEILKNLNHPSIPYFVDFFREEDHLFLVMEFIDGKTVEDLIFDDLHVFSEKESLEILLKVLKVVQYLHNKRLIHRDLRLPNILINNSKVFVIDLGLAAYIDEDPPSEMERVAPEKRLFREVSVESDFYALGHFLLFLLYSGYDSTSKLERTWEEELELMSSTRQILRRMLKIESSYSNVGELMEELTKAIHQQ